MRQRPNPSDRWRRHAYSRRPVTLQGSNPNFRLGQVYTWTFGVQHAFTNNLVLNAAYVGTRGVDLGAVVDLNEPSLGAPEREGRCRHRCD